MPKNLPELRALDSGDLIEQIEASKEELFNLRFQLATGQLDNPMRLKQVRHDMARMLTILRERELGHEPFEAEETEVAAERPRRRLRKRAEEAPAKETAAPEATETSEGGSEPGDAPVEEGEDYS